MVVQLTRTVGCSSVIIRLQCRMQMSRFLYSVKTGGKWRWLRPANRWPVIESPHNDACLMHSFHIANTATLKLNYIRRSLLFHAQRHTDGWAVSTEHSGKTPFCELLVATFVMHHALSDLWNELPLFLSLIPASFRQATLILITRLIRLILGATRHHILHQQ